MQVPVLTSAPVTTVSVGKITIQHGDLTIVLEDVEIAVGTEFDHQSIDAPDLTDTGLVSDEENVA